MAVQTTEEFKNGGATSYSITIEYLKASDIKVRIGGALQTYVASSPSSGEYTVSGTTVTLGAQAASGTGNVHIYRDTDVNTAAAVFAAGSSIRAADLNAIHDMARMGVAEARSQTITADIKDDAITSAKIADDQINSEHYAAGSIDLEHMSANSVDSDQYVDGSIDHVHLANDVIDGDNIQDDVIDSEHYVAGSIDTEHIANVNVTTAKLANDAVTAAKLADNAVVTANIVDSNVTHAKLANDAVDGDNIADDSINSEHYVDGSIDTAHIGDGQVTHVKLANDAVDGDNIADDSINSEHYADGSIDTAHIADSQITTAKIADGAITDAKIAGGSLDNRYYTETELDAGQLDNRYYTEAESDARYFNVSTGDTIKDGDTFPDNDTTIATTAAINDRIIDLVDDVGGFVPIANETSFPTANPDVNNGSGTLVSIKAIASTRTPSTGTVTIANGAGTGNTVTITGCGSTVLTAGFGVIVETTTTLHTYAFHRLVPKATEVTTVAGISSNITTVANNTSNINAVAADASDIGTVAGAITNVNNVGNNISNVNAVAGNATNINAVQSNASNINTVAGISANVTSVANNSSNINSAVSNASNINSAVSNATNINTVAGSIGNVNTTAGSIGNVNTVASNIASVNNFANQYRIGANNPTTSLDVGDLFFNTTSDSLKVYTGSAWVDGVTATGNFAVTTGNTFSGSNNHNDNVKSIYGTGSDFEIFHDGSDSIINEKGTGSLKIQNTGTNKLTVDASGITVSGNVAVTGNVDGRDVAADGTKLDGIESNATADQTAAEIRTLVESASDSNVFTDADHTKLNGIEASATADQTAAEIRTLVESASDSNVFTDADHTKLNGIATGAIADIVNDTSPQLGGNLDVQSNKITTATSNGNIQIEPNGTGVAEIRGAGGNDGTLQLNCSVNSHGVKIKSPAHSAAASYTLTLPVNIVNGQFLKTDANGVLSWAAVDLTALSASNLTSGTIPDARFPATLPAVSGANLTNVESPEVYGFTGLANGNLQLTTTNKGADNISGADYAAFEDTLFAASGFSFSVNQTTGNLIATI